MKLHLIALGATALLVLACSDDTETSTGAGGSGASATGSGAGGAGGGGSACDLGDDGCVGCTEAFDSADCKKSQLCTDSVAIFDAAIECACQECATECVDTCTDQDAESTAECNGCVATNCPDETTACANDTTD